MYNFYQGSNYVYTPPAQGSMIGVDKRVVEWEINPPLPTIERFPTWLSPPPSSSPISLDDSPTSFDSNSNSNLEFEFDFDFTYSHTPRKAPSPPCYSPRRARARHIRMREPAKLGLFTVSEEAEMDRLSQSQSQSGSGSRSREWETPSSYSYSSSSSSGTSSPSERSESDVDINITTPESEVEDPFSPSPSPSPFTSPRTRNHTPRSTTQVPTLAAAVNAGTYRPRRPPPLALHLITRPTHLSTLSLETSPISALSPSPMIEPLAPALPICKPSQTKSRGSTPQKRPSPDQEVDLVSALEELLTTCGEDLSDVKVDQFPLPPSQDPTWSEPTPVSATFLHTPTTPPSNSRQLPSPQIPSAPRQKQRKMSNPPRLELGALGGNHSFLLDMSTSRSESSGSQRSSSSTSGRTSSSSGRRLPQRGGIPMEWVGVAI